MFNLIDAGRMPGRIATITGLVFASTVLTPAAFAGSCPADKIKADVREPVKFAAVGVTDTTLGAIDLEKEPAAIKDRQFAIPQADDRTERHRALAQPRRPPGAHLRRRG
jgi:hypothetical protein